MGGGSSTEGKGTADPKDKVRQLFKKSDLDGNGQLSKDEFVRIARVLVPDVSDKKLKRLYKQVDIDNSKYIDVDELLKWVFGNDKIMLNVDDALDAEKVEDEETDEIIRELKEKRARNKHADAEHEALMNGRKRPERQNGEEAFREELVAFLQSSKADDMNDCEAMLARGERLGVSASALKPLRDRIDFILDRYSMNRARHSRVKQRERDRAEGEAEARRKHFIKDELWDE